MELLRAQALTVAIGGRRLCRDLDLVISAGQTWAILGPNGSGKTTLLHTLAGLRPAQGGEVRLLGRPLPAWRPRERARVLGLLLQDYDDPFPSTVLETALMGRHPHLGRWQREGAEDLARVREALHLMDLDTLETRTVATLSGGERRRLATAALLAQDPRLLLLDEPTNHLDLHHQVRVPQLLARRAADKQGAAVMVLHDVTAAVRCCDHALLMFADGEPLSGTMTAVVTEENLSRLYGHPVRCLADTDGPVWSPRYA
jgi:iron complex transport system ATP-binding protein